MDDAPTIAIVDDHLLLVETLRAAFSARGVRTLAFGPDLKSELLPGLLGAAPDLVLLDLDLGDFGDSTVLVRPLVAAGIRVLMITGLTDRLRIARALEQGAIGCQSKADGFDALLNATERALYATAQIDPAGRASLLLELQRARADRTATMAPFESLTERERATLVALSDGMTVNQIARAWTVSQATVRSHIQRILCKLAVGSQVQALALAMHSGWLSRPTVRSGR